MDGLEHVQLWLNIHRYVSKSTCVEIDIGLHLCVHCILGRREAAVKRCKQNWMRLKTQANGQFSLVGGSQHVHVLISPCWG